MRRFIGILFKIAVGVIVLVTVTIVTCVLIGVTIDLSSFKPKVEKAASTALNRKVEITGPVVFQFSTWPAIDIQGVRIANPPGAPTPTFIKAGHAKLKIALFSLLKREIHIGEVSAKDITLNLRSHEKEPGKKPAGEKKTEKQEPGHAQTAPEKQAITFIGLDRLSLKNITITYFDEALKKTLKLHLDSMEGEIRPGEPITLSVKGAFQAHPFDIKIRGASLEKLLAKSTSWAFTLRGKIEGKKLNVRGNMAARAEIPRVDLSFDIQDINVGAILSTLGIVRGLEATVGDAGFKISLRGGNLKQILKNSTMTFSIKKGKWTFTIPNTKTKIDITHLSGAILVDKGKPVALDVKGFLDDAPLKLKIVGASLLNFVAIPENIPLLIDAELAKMRLHFSSKMALPMSSQNLKMALKLSGDRLDHLNNPLGLKLPAIGPLSLDAKMTVTRKGYDLSRLKIIVGQSQLDGQMSLDLSGDKPRLKASLVSDLIRIDDFVLKKVKPSEKKQAEKAPSQPTSGKELKDILSYDFLSRFDADIRVEAQKVTSLKDDLGSALVVLSLKDTRLKIAPVRINVPGGKVDLGFDYHPTPENVTIHLKATVDKFDFGILARRAKPTTKMGGKFSLNAELRSVTPSLKEMMKTAQGHFSFFLVPKNFSAGILDLWAVNLLSAIMTKATEKDKSKINCLVVGLTMKDGVMEERTIYMDTTKMRIVGKAQIDFKTRKIDVILSPQAKRPEFFSLAVPIMVHGTIDDFKLGVNKIQLISSVVSFITSPLHVPFRRLFSKKVPADGRKACLEAWKKTKSKNLKPENRKNP